MTNYLVFFIAAFSGLTKYFTNHPVFDLKTEIKRVLFQQNIMSPVSDDAGLFTIVMSNFSQYEKVVCTQLLSLCVRQIA